MLLSQVRVVQFLITFVVLFRSLFVHLSLFLSAIVLSDYHFGGISKLSLYHTILQVNSMMVIDYFRVTQ